MAAYAAVTTSDSTGVLLCGMQVYDPSTRTFLKFPKKYGYNLNTTTLPLGLRQFFSDSRNKFVHRHNIPPVIARLRRLHSALSHLPGHRMISGSILLVYEGDPFHQSLESTPPSEPRSFADIKVPTNPDLFVDVRVIDFNHSYFKTEYEGVDTNYLEGLMSLIKMLEAVYTMPFSPPPKGKLRADNSGEWATWWENAPKFEIEGHKSEVLSLAEDSFESLRKWWKIQDPK
ncbi:Inositol hexakisphosphate kinase 1 [Nowakowskiella sp. JEL0078]|nr:Inositol hexakisphosphate kinase 1 [Nowakowskiella sp. JEL0078]